MAPAPGDGRGLESFRPPPGVCGADVGAGCCDVAVVVVAPAEVAAGCEGESLMARAEMDALTPPG
jgi:hypothetical protein